jgi:hypothetical protein
VADDIALIVGVVAELTPNAASAEMKYVGIVAVCVTWITLAPKPTAPQPVVTVEMLNTHFNPGEVETVCMFGVVFMPAGQADVPAVFELWCRQSFSPMRSWLRTASSHLFAGLLQLSLNVAANRARPRV